MLQTGFLTILAVVMLHHINCAPVMNMESTTGVPISSTCEIGVPNLKATLEDSSCILDTLSETASSLRIQYSDMSRPVRSQHNNSYFCYGLHISMHEMTILTFDQTLPLSQHTGRGDFVYL